MVARFRLRGVCLLFASLTAIFLLAVGPVRAAGTEQAATSPAAAAKPDPLAIYYGNTVVCGRTYSGNDLCHVWFYRNGKMIIFDQGGAHPAHYKVFSYRKSGAISVCMYWNDTHVTLPPDAIPQPTAMRAPMPKMAGKDPGRYCKNNGAGRTTCTSVGDVASLSAEDQALAHDTMGERWHEGMCYPYREDVKLGAVWLEWDDPSPSEAKGDKVWLLAGHH